MSVSISSASNVQAQQTQYKVEAKVANLHKSQQELEGHQMMMLLNSTESNTHNSQPMNEGKLGSNINISV